MNAVDATIDAAVARAWRTALDTGHSAPDDDFFAAGGHSLVAARLVTLVQRDLAVKVPTGAVLNARTLGGLIEHIRGLAPDAGVPSLAETGSAPFTGPGVPLAAGLPAAWPVAVWTAEGDLDSGALTRALSALARRHDVIGGSLADRAAGIPVQYRSAGSLPATWDVPAALLPEALPGTHAVVLQRQGLAGLVALVMDSRLVDAASSVVISTELPAAYAAARADSEWIPAPAPASYADFRHWYGRLLAGSRTARLDEFWRHELHGVTGSVPAGLVPTGWPPRLAFHEVDREIIRRVADVTGQLAIPAETFWLAAFMLLKADVKVVPVEVPYRRLADFADTVGPLARCVPVKRPGPLAQPFLRFLSMVRRSWLAVMAHQDLGVTGWLEPDAVAYRKELITPEQDLTVSGLRPLRVAQPRPAMPTAWLDTHNDGSRLVGSCATDGMASDLARWYAIVQRAVTDPMASAAQLAGGGDAA